MRALFLLVLVLGPLQVEPFPIPSFSDLKNLFDFAYDIYDKVNNAHDVYAKFQTSASLNDIMNVVSDISRDISQMGSKIEKKMDTVVQKLLTRLPLMNDISADSRFLHQQVVAIDYLYRDFKVYSKKPVAGKGFNNETLRTFSLSLTNPGGRADVSAIVNDMHSVIVPGRGSALRKSFILLISEKTKESFYDACDTGKPPHQHLYDMYILIVVSELRAFAMLAFAYTYRSTFQGSFMREVRHREKQFELRIAQYLYIFEQALKWAPRTLRACDPKAHRRDNTFLEFERFINALIIQESALNSEHSCQGSCEDQSNPTSWYKGCGESYSMIECSSFGSTQSCHGTIIDCTSGKNKMEVCIAPFPEDTPYNSRRYMWFKDGEGTLFGNNEGKCPGKMRYPEWHWKHSVYSCDVCRCTCIDDSYRSSASHFVSLREVVSDIDNNMVVTGLRFVITDRIMQVQIQQGKLSREGTIEKGSVSWKPAERLSFEGAEAIRRKRYAFSINRRGRGERSLDLELDIAAFTKRSRQFNLDQLQVPKGHVITGIKLARLSKVSSAFYRPIQVEIRATPLNYTAGKLVDIDSSVWITPEDMKNVLDAYKSERKQIQQVDWLKSPLDILITIPDFEPNKWIQLERTGLREDAGQTVIPFLDGVPVVTNPALPLTGVNLFHKAGESYGGLLSFQISTIDRSEYVVYPDKNYDEEDDEGDDEEYKK